MISKSWNEKAKGTLSLSNFGDDVDAAKACVEEGSRLSMTVGQWVEETDRQSQCGRYSHVQSEAVRQCVRCCVVEYLGGLHAVLQAQVDCSHRWEDVRSTCSLCGAKFAEGSDGSQ